MIIQNERPQEKRLNKLGLRIVTSFWSEGRVRQRSSDRSLHDDIVNGVIMNKKYYRENRLTHTETVFNPLMQYSFVIQNQMEAETSCPNCGARGKTADFANGCPYCGTCYNIGYGERKSAGKNAAERKSMTSAEYAGTMAAILAACMGLGVLLMRISGRTFGLFDILKGLVFGGIAGFLLFWFYYTRRSAVITRRDEEKYQRQLAQIRVFESRLASFDLTAAVFYTNLNSELNLRFFDDTVPEYADIADWDVLDYGEYSVSGSSESDLAVSLSADLRILRMRGNRLRPEKARIHICMKPNPVYLDSLRPGANVIHCRRCGSSIDVSQPCCSHCGNPVLPRQRLFLSELNMS